MTNKYLDLARVYFRKPNSLGINAQIAIKGFARWLDAEHELAPGGSQTQPNTAAPESGTGAASPTKLQNLLDDIEGLWIGHACTHYESFDEMRRDINELLGAHEPKASRVGDLTAAEAVRFFGGKEKPKSSVIPTWRERCETHPEHQNGVIITSRMIELRMQEEIDALRAALEQRK